jgi:superoxide dismutase, Cu-Zn family
MRRTAGALIGCMLAACAQSADTAKQDETAASPTLDSAVAGAIGDTVEDTTSAGGAASGARATMRDAQGQELGVLTLRQTPEGVTIEGRLSGLAPGEHGFHAHAVGRCEPPFQTAGPHWNPANKQHGEQNPQGAHAGDLLNLTVPANGIAEISVSTRGGTFDGDVALLDADGAALVLHAKADDYRTDPSGNSGDRIACGVVERS